MGTPRKVGVRLVTERLVLRELDSTRAGDVAFMLALLNDPGFVRGIADVGVRDLAGAAGYIERACESFFDRHGFGMFGVERVAGAGELIGVMGLLSRASLDAPDLGFAFLEAHCRQGFAREAGMAALRDARERVGLARLVAITDRANVPSQRCLAALGFHHQGAVRLREEAQELMLFAVDLARLDLASSDRGPN